jgi:hypothetical protein
MCGEHCSNAKVKTTFQMLNAQVELHFVPCMVKDDGIKVRSPFCPFENPSCMVSSSLVGTNVNYLSPSNALIV